MYTDLPHDRPSNHWSPGSQDAIDNTRMKEGLGIQGKPHRSTTWLEFLLLLLPLLLM